MDGWMDGWINELQLCLSGVSLGFYLYQVIFVFGNFLHPREGKKKKPLLQRIFWGEKMVYCCHIMKDFIFLNLPYLEVMS
jgi:hypothetical protein